MTELLFKVLGSALSIWESKESRRYIDKLIKLEREYYEEYNKEISDDARLDVIRFELQLISKAFNSEIGKKNPKNK